MRLQGGQIEGPAGDASYGPGEGSRTGGPVYGISRLSASSPQILSRRFFVLSICRAASESLSRFRTMFAIEPEQSIGACFFGRYRN